MTSASPSPSVNPPGVHWAALGRALLRVILAIFIIALLAAAIYVAARWLYPQLIQPVQQNSADLQDLSQRQTLQDQQLSDRLAELQARIATLEAQNASQDESMTGLQNQLNQSEATRVAQSTQLMEIYPLPGEISYLATKQEYDAEQAAQLSGQINGPASQLAALQREVQIVRVMNLVNRARMNLSQNNPGLARQDLASARDMLAALVTAGGLPVESQASINRLLERADLALVSLPNSPVIAAGDLDLLWQMLVAGQNYQPGQPFILPTACEYGSCLPTVTPSFEMTLPPTLVPTSTPTPAAGRTPTRTPTPVLTLAP